MADLINTTGGIRPDVAIRPNGVSANKAQSGSDIRSADGLTFSKHLSERLHRRRIDLSGERLSRLAEAVERVAEKGAHDSVVLLDNLAVLVSVTKRTVLTAIETEKMKDGVFTNIDSMVVG